MLVQIQGAVLPNDDLAAPGLIELIEKRAESILACKLRCTTKDINRDAIFIGIAPPLTAKFPDNIVIVVLTDMVGTNLPDF